MTACLRERMLFDGEEEDQQEDHVTRDEATRAGEQEGLGSGSGREVCYDDQDEDGGQVEDAIIIEVEGCATD